jgi:negative regulator of flagellin synthesis FlgM
MAEISNIKSVNQNVVTPRGVDAAKGRAADSSSAPAYRPATDTVSLTNAATQLQSIQQNLADVSPVNQERVDAIKAAIADGSYQVDSGKLAQNLIDFEQQF